MQQSWDEGRDISSLQEIMRISDNHTFYTYEENERMGELLDRFAGLPLREDANLQEPSDLEEIHALQKRLYMRGEKPDRVALEDKIYGAWIGRVAGCLLGKPVGNWPVERIAHLAKAGGNYPITKYLRGKSRVLLPDKFMTEEQYLANWFAEKLDGYAPADDDTNYTVLGLKILETYGRQFTTMDVAESWLFNFPALALCTAEHVAYRNLLNHMPPPLSATYRNPDREWMGAQIRGDVFGYIHPGEPYAAADMDYRDACMTHTKNEIYGGMFAAAMIAQAATVNDTETIVRVGISAIPYTSRLHLYPDEF